MGMTDKEVRHRVINSHLPNRFSDSSTMLQIKGVRFHPLNVAFFTECLS